MKKSFLILFLFAILSAVGCKKEIDGGASLYGLGRIELALSAGDVVFVGEGTRASASEPSLSDVVFTISGRTAQGETVEGQPLELTQKEASAYCYFMAGTYTITAIYAPEGSDDGVGALCYSGSSEEFTVEVGGNTGAIQIAMTPSNARVKLIFDSSLKEFYSSVSVDFTNPRIVSISSSDADANGCITVYLPSGSAGVYGISATPLSDSGAAKVGITGLRLPAAKDDAQPLCLEAGKEYTLKVKFAPGGIAVFLDGDSAPAYTTQATWNGLFS